MRLNDVLIGEVGSSPHPAHGIGADSDPELGLEMQEGAGASLLGRSWDTETTNTVVALRALARRAHAMLKEATGT